MKPEITDDLIARVEGGTRSDRPLDHELHVLLMDAEAYSDPIDHAPRYTSSVDAVLALIEAKLPGWWGSTDVGDWRDNPVGARLRLGENTAAANGRASTPARALLSAFLRAYRENRHD